MLAHLTVKLQGTHVISHEIHDSLRMVAKLKSITLHTAIDSQSHEKQVGNPETITHSHIFPELSPTCVHVC